MSRRNLFLGLVLLAFTLIFLRTAWVGDDVYITLRTVDNFVNGYGLTWNVAERVQSYTHPLWMFLFAIIYAPTRDAYFTALFASFLASLLTFWLVARRDGFAALGVLTLFLSKAFTDYSASGLENPLTHLLLVLFFIAFIEKQSSAFHLALIASMIFLNRQDAILFTLPALAYLLVTRLLIRHSQSDMNVAPQRIMLQMFLGFLPLLLWEAFSLFYYGFPFPNTYYAKLGTGIPLNQFLPHGITYYLDSLQRDPLTLIVISVGILLTLWRGQICARLLALGSLLYLGYVLSIGGDFMSGRFFTASLLVSVLLLMYLLRDLAPRWKYTTLAALVILGLFAWPPSFVIVDQVRFTDQDLLTGINDERAYYYPISGLMNYRVGKEIPFSGEGWVEHGKALRENGKSVVDEKNVGYVGYFAGPAVHIVDLYALCDPLLARLLISGAWRIGHFEREVPAGYLPTLRTGVNQIADPNLAAYYDQLALITRGPLFSRERLIAIWKMNTGQFDFLLESFAMIPGLDGLRAIAFLLVFSLHTDYIYIGWVGVQLFFVLSGFLITNILLRMKEQFSAGDYFKKFYGRRFLRIFPLYYLYLLIMFIVTVVLIHFEYRVTYMERFQEQLPYALAYIYNFFNASPAYGGESWLIGHLWSLSVEEQFYLIWPLLIFLIPKQHLKKLFIGAIIAGPLFRLALTALYKYNDVNFLFQDMSVVIYVLPFSQLDAFGLGAFITRFDFPKARWQFFVLLLLLPVIGFITTHISTGDWGASTALGFQYPLDKDLKQVWGYSYLNYTCALLIYLVVREKFFVRFLDNKFLNYLGKISYGLYVYHFAIVWFVRRIRDFGIPEPVAKPLTLVLSAILLFFVASLSYKYFEKPILDLKDRYFALKKEDVKKATG